jgi:4-amino-4-deoxy-L-arabinose transferase-like glycosyltransferase
LAAAVLFALASALQHRSAGLVANNEVPGRAELTGFITNTLRHPLWAGGLAAGVAGSLLHALALRDGPLTLVQPLLVCGVVFALPLRSVLERRRPQPEELGWALALAVGLILVLVIATPAGGAPQAPDFAPTVVSGTLIGLGTVGFGVAGRRTSGRRAALLLGAAAALASAATAGLLKEVMGIVSRGPGGLATSWPAYGLLAAGAFELVVSQLAYQAGPLRVSLPVITTVGPMASLAIGVAVFDERFRSGPVDLVCEAVGLALVVVAAIGLTRSADEPSGPLPRSQRDDNRPSLLASPVPSEAI